MNVTSSLKVIGDVGFFLCSSSSFRVKTVRGKMNTLTVGDLHSGHCVDDD